MVTTTYIPSTPQKFVNVDKEKALKQGRDSSAMSLTPFRRYMGGLFVNYFNDFGRAGKCVCRQKRLTAPAWTTQGNSTCAMPRATWCRFRR